MNPSGPILRLLGASRVSRSAKLTVTPRRPQAAQDVVAPGADAQAEPRLVQRALVALRLLARGYSPDRIAALQGVTPGDTRSDLERARTLLASPTVPDAIAEAKRRRLFD